MPERLGAAKAAATARPWSRPPARAAELAELLQPVVRACAEALPFPSGRSADADAKLTTHASAEPS